MDITITHKPLNQEEIAALTPSVLHDSPRGGYRLLWGTMLFCGGYALYRGGAAATLPILILTGFYFFCAKRLFWPNRKLQEEDCRRILSARPYYSMPYTVTLTDDELSLDSSVHAFSTDYRMLGPVMQVPCGTDELLYFPNTVSLILRRSEFPQREDYDAFLARLTEVGKSDREPSSPATPGFQRRLALVRRTIWVQGLPRDAILAMVNALFCALLLWQGAKLPFFPAFGAVFLWSICGFRLILMNRQKRQIRENQCLLPAEFHFYFDREHGMLEGRTERSVNRISVSYLMSSREKNDCLILRTGLFPWCVFPGRIFLAGKLDGVSANHGQSGRSGKTGGSVGRTTGTSAETWVLLGLCHLGGNFPVSLFPLLRLFRLRQNDFCPNAFRPAGRSA